MSCSSLRCFLNCLSLCLKPMSLSPTTPDYLPLNWAEWSEIRRRGKKQSNNWAHAEQRPLMCFLNGLPKSFSRNVGPSQYISVEKYRQLSLFERVLLPLQTSFPLQSPSLLHLESGRAISTDEHVWCVWRPLCAREKLDGLPFFFFCTGGDDSTVRSWPPLQVHAKKGQQLYVCVTARPRSRKRVCDVCVKEKSVRMKEAIQTSQVRQRGDSSSSVGAETRHLWAATVFAGEPKLFVQPSFPFPRARTASALNHKRCTIPAENFLHAQSGHGGQVAIEY